MRLPEIVLCWNCVWKHINWHYAKVEKKNTFIWEKYFPIRILFYTIHCRYPLHIVCYNIPWYTNKKIVSVHKFIIYGITFWMAFNIMPLQLYNLSQMDYFLHFEHVENIRDILKHKQTLERKFFKNLINIFISIDRKEKCINRKK